MLSRVRFSLGTRRLSVHWKSGSGRSMQAIACENNLSETGSSYGGRRLSSALVHSCRRSGFMRTCDVGHRVHYFEPTDAIGELSSIPNQERHTGSKSRGRSISMDFPSRPPAETKAHPKLIEALGASPRSSWRRATTWWCTHLKTKCANSYPTCNCFQKSTSRSHRDGAGKGR